MPHKCSYVHYIDRNKAINALQINNTWEKLFKIISYFNLFDNLMFFKVIINKIIPPNYSFARKPHSLKEMYLNITTIIEGKNDF